LSPLASRNPLAVHFHVFAKLLRGLKATRSLRAVVVLLAGPPRGRTD